MQHTITADDCYQMGLYVGRHSIIDPKSGNVLPLPHQPTGVQDRVREAERLPLDLFSVFLLAFGTMLENRAAKKKLN